MALATTDDNRAMQVLSVNVALAQALATPGGEVASAIRKQPVDGPVEVRSLGLVGDEQADLSVHGGLAKAVYAYPVVHHAFWQTVRAQARVAAPGEPLPPGLFGENLALSGIDEGALWIGDRLEFPDCVLGVSEPRFPCFKFNAVMGFPKAAKLMVESGYCGAYLAVLSPGTITAGQSFALVPGRREVGLRELFRARTRGKSF